MDNPGKPPAAKLNADFCAGAVGKFPPLPESAKEVPLFGTGVGEGVPVAPRLPAGRVSAGFERCAQPARERQNHSRGGVLLAKALDKIIVVRGAVWLVMANVTPLRGVQSLHASRFPEKYLFREKAQSLPRLSSPAHLRCGGSLWAGR